MHPDSFPRKINIFEVGPRDGLQNEKVTLSLDEKFTYIRKLAEAGLQDIEVGAFVRADKIPQMADTDLLLQRLHRFFARKSGKPNLWCLVPNEKGLERALDADCRHIAVFTGATNSFTEKNIGMTIKESLSVFRNVLERAHREKMRTRAYLSVCWKCPYEGEVSPRKVVTLVHRLLDMGVEQVSLGDTIGHASPRDVGNLLSYLVPEIKRSQIAGHFHDTLQMALANCLMALLCGVQCFDASTGGIGGCNYAPGATGNLATETLLRMLDGMRLRTGIEHAKIAKARLFILNCLEKESLT